MPPIRNTESNTYCPDCAEPVYRKSQDYGSGRLRYAHRNSQHLECKWNGLNADGAALDALCGVPQNQSKLLKKGIVAKRGQRAIYVITSAQNATYIHANAFQSLLTYCKKRGAQLLVIPYRYKNPTSMWTKKAQHDDWWDAPLLPYLINHRVDLNKHLVLLADIMTQPTAIRPLEGFESITGPQSGIIGHPKLELMTVPTPGQRLPKILTTTGSITKKNYIPSRAGKRAEFHHTFGATVVEIDGGRFHVRQLNMLKDGSFCDLLAEYDGKEVRTYDRITALVMGDTHVEVVEQEVVQATFLKPNSIVKTLQPQALVWHDVLDGSAKNHWERGRVFHDYVKHRLGRDDVQREAMRTLRFIDSMTPADTKNYIVPSNHHDFLREWVENTDPRKDPVNCVFWAELFQAIATHEQTTWRPGGVGVKDPFAYLGEKHLKSNTTFLRRDEQFQIRGIEIGYHGDRGPGGKPGTRLAFSKIGSKSIIGHTHAPGITEGAYQVGTSSRLDLTYTAGTPSAWLHTHCAIYPNGKRCLINIIEGEWRA